MLGLESTSAALLTVAVTGHRDVAPDSTETLRADVERILESLVKAAPSTTIIFLTGLAEGADQIAAEVALSIPDVTVMAALPMAVEDYRRDFSGAALETFNRTLARCHDWFEVVPMSGSASVTSAEQRDLHYQHFGRWLARNCHIMIAAWDGSAPQFVGGTADNVYFKAEAMSPLPSLLSDQDDLSCDPGLILWCPVTRSGSQRTDQLPSTIQVVGAEGVPRAWTGDFGVSTTAFETFNEEAPRVADAATSTTGLFEAADGLASTLQNRYQRLLKSIMATGVLAVASVDVLQTTENAAFAIALVVLVTASVSMWLWLARTGLRDRFQQARALAEGARIQAVWLAADVKTSTAEAFLNAQGARVEWIRAALRSAWLMDRRARPMEADFEPAREWLDDQLRYFLGSPDRPGAIRRTWLRQRSLRRRASVMFLLAGLALFIDVVTIALGISAAPWIVQVVRLTWSVGLGIGIAVLSYSELMGFGQLSQRYALTVPYLSQGRDDLRQAVSIDAQQAAQAVVRVVGVEALREAGDWLALHSQRQVRPV